MRLSQGLSAISGPQPVLRGYQTPAQQTKYIIEFVRQMSRHLRLKLSSAVVLVPYAEAGRAVADSLTRRDLPAKYMTGGELDLSAEVVKILTLHSAKRLGVPDRCRDGSGGRGPSSDASRRNG